MKKTHIIVGTTLLSLIATISAACGGNSGPKEKFEISVSARSMLSEQSVLEIWKAGYEKLHPNVTINISGWGSNEGTSESYVMKNALNREYLTNIIYTTDDSTANLALRKNFVDLRPYFESSEETDYSKYYSTMLDMTSFYGEFRPTTKYAGSFDREKSDDAQYGVYFAPREYNMPAILCNVTLMKENLATDEEKANWGKDSLKKLWLRLGESTEWNWTTFVKALQNISDECETLNASGDLGYRAIELHQTWEPIYTTIMKELGGDGLFAKDSRDETHFNLSSSANRAAFDRILNDFGKDQHKYMIDTDYGNENFKNRNIFATTVSYPEVGNYYGAFSKVDYELGSIDIPCEYVGAGCGGYGILVDKANETQTLTTGETAKTADLCWDFIKYMISKDGQNLAGKEGYIQPVLKELADTGDWLESYDGKIDNVTFATAKELRLDTYCFADPALRNDLRTECTAFFRDLFEPKRASYSDLISNTENNVNQILGLL